MRVQASYVSNTVQQVNIGPAVVDQCVFGSIEYGFDRQKALIVCPCIYPAAYGVFLEGMADIYATLAILDRLYLYIKTAAKAGYSLCLSS